VLEVDLELAGAHFVDIGIGVDAQLFAGAVQVVESLPDRSAWKN
jgi:hypothetical protein